MGKDRKSFPLAVLPGKPVEVPLDRFIAAKEDDGCLREGPLQMGIVDLASSGTVLLSVRFMRALD